MTDILAIGFPIAMVVTMIEYLHTDIANGWWVFEDITIPAVI